MFRRMIAMVKKIALASFCVVALTAPLNAVTIPSYSSKISISNIRQIVIQKADEYLAGQGFPASQIPPRLMTEYYQKIDTVVDSLKQQAQNNLLDERELSSAVYYQFSKFYDNLRTVVLTHHMDSAVTNAIHEEFRRQNISVSSLPSSMTQEFQSRRQTILRRLRNIMNVDNRDYVRTNEIERFVKEEMTALIRRAEQHIKNSAKPNTSFNLWDFLFGDNAAHQSDTPATISTEEPSKVKRFHLESKVLDIADKQLRQNGIDPDHVPARTVAAYGQSIQKVISGLRERMQNYGRDYVTVAEIELFVSQKLKNVIDTIKLVGQMCSICRDGYSPRELIGSLQCGHIFHKKCISTWFTHKRTCPDCNQGNAEIVAQEIVL